MSESKTFDLYAVLAVTHRLPSDLDQFVEIIGFLAGGPVNTLAWAHVREVGARWLFHQHPQLLTIPPAPDFDGDEAAMDAWADTRKQALGAELTINPVPAAWWDVMAP